MRDSVEESELFGSDQLDTYQQMADKQLSLELSRQGGIGIARALVEQMQTRGYVTGSDAEAVTPVTDPAVNGTGLPISGIDTLKLQASPAANTFTVDKRA
jgi:flagellar protein FlgJ